MLDGVEVLNTIHHINYGWGYSSTGLIFAFVFLFGLYIFIKSIQADKSVLLFIGLIITLIGLNMSIVSFEKGRIKDSYDTYQVLINNDVSFTDLCDSYEIISQNGRIYELKLKDS